MLDRSDKGQKFAQLYRAEYKRDPDLRRRFLRRHAHAGCRHRVHPIDRHQEGLQAIANGKYAGVTASSRTTPSTT